MDSRPPAEPGNAPRSYRGKGNDHQAGRGEPSDNVGGVQPRVKAVADETDIFVRKTQGQQDQHDKNNLKQAIDSREDVEKTIERAGEKRTAVPFPHHDRDWPKKQGEDEKTLARPQNRN